MNGPFGVGARYIEQRGKNARIAWAWLAFALGVVMLYLTTPSYVFHPFCKNLRIFEQTVEIEVDGTRYRDIVVHQDATPRRWISFINMGGCRQTHGEALTFRLTDGRAVIIPAHLCYKARSTFQTHGSVDLTDVCKDARQLPDNGYMIDNADNPRFWKPFRYGDAVGVNIVRSTAMSVWEAPRDTINKTAPALLNARFTYEGSSWSRSPEKFIPFSRRHSFFELPKYEVSRLEN